MFTVFDFFSLVLTLAAVGVFGYRYAKQHPPVYPYLIIASTSLVAHWLGEAGGGIFAMMLLIAAAFSFLGCLLYPNRRSLSNNENSQSPQANES